MSNTPPHLCEQMRVALAEEALPISYYARFREYGIDYVDGGSAFQQILYCPFCGQRLPSSVRDQFFELLETLHLEPESEQLPHEMKSDLWWRERGI